MLPRRTFLAVAGSSLVTSSLYGKAAAAKKLRVAVIGHTGRGNYGHGLDTVWLDLPETEIVAVADADAGGLAKAKEKLKVGAAFADYREMLSTAKPDITAVCPRFVDEHAAMILAAIDGGSRGIYVEKPLCRTPAEADAILAACAKRGTKLAVAHRNRYHSVLPMLDKLIADGAIGRVLEVRGRGKGDKRGGSEDLWVLGSHVLNLMTYFGGAPTSCSASLLQDGRPVTKADVREGNEGVGPLAGNEVHARFAMPRVPVGYFDSLADDGTKGSGFGLQIVGSDGVIDLKCDRDPLAHLIRGNPFAVSKSSREWVPVSSAGVGIAEPSATTASDVAHHLTSCRDLIAAMQEDREPLCGVRDGALTIEMIMAVFESHRQGGAAVAFPLAERGNPLANL